MLRLLLMGYADTRRSECDMGLKHGEMDDVVAEARLCNGVTNIIIITHHYQSYYLLAMKLFSYLSQ